MYVSVSPSVKSVRLYYIYIYIYTYTYTCLYLPLVLRYYIYDLVYVFIRAPAGGVDGTATKKSMITKENRLGRGFG